MRSEQEAANAIEKYADMVRRICMVHLKNEADTQDIFQEVFLKYVLNSDPFCDAKHEKAWLIRVTLNACKDLLKSFFRRNTVPLDHTSQLIGKENVEYNEVLEAVLSLPQKYRDVVYLHYYEGFTAVEIGVLLHKNPNTIYTHLTRAKAVLKEKLGGDSLE